MSNEFLWVEKYRPAKIEETVLPKSLKVTFQKIVTGGELPNMLFTGTAGLGKTTVARALCNELDCDYILINGSEEGNIDTLRTTIKQFASSVSLFKFLREFLSSMFNSSIDDGWYTPSIKQSYQIFLI